MDDHQDPPTSELVIRTGQRVIAIPGTADGQMVTRYFVEEGARAPSERDASVAAALNAAGAWADLDWDEMEAALDRIRHESRPTPPITL